MRLAGLFVSALFLLLVVGCGGGSSGQEEEEEEEPAAEDEPSAEVVAAAERAMEEHDLKAVLVRVTQDGEEVATVALGESMTGVPATVDMHFCNGAVAISYVVETVNRSIRTARTADRYHAG